MDLKYYWFDTNCFSDLLNGSFLMLEKDKIFGEVNNNEATIVISPFVLYEILKGRDEISEIIKLYDKMKEFPTFYVANFLNIFKCRPAILDVKEIIDQIKMGEVLGSNPIEYAEYRDGIKHQVGQVYSCYMLQYAKVAAYIYLICNECDIKGNIPTRTRNKLQIITEFDHFGNNSKNFEEILSDFFINYNCRDISFTKPDKGLMQKQILEFVNIMLNVAETSVQITEENDCYTDDVFNLRLVENDKKIRIDLNTYHETLNTVSEKTNNILRPKAIYKKFIDEKIKSVFFTEVFLEFINKGVLYKDLNNDFIDALNIYCAGVFLNGCENYYYTDEKFWVDFLNSRANLNLFENNVLGFKYKQWFCK